MATRAHALLVVIALLCSAAVADALKIDFQAWVDRARTSQSQPLQLTLSIRSDESLSHVPAPELDLGNFDVQGPAVSTSTNVSIANFKQSVSHIRELTYTLYPKRTGRIVIGPARIRLGGQEYATKALVVEVVKATSRSRPGAAAAPGDAASETLEDQVFVRAKAAQTRAYVGQPLAIEYALCYRVRLDNVGFKEIPSFEGFWVKELFTAQTLQNTREVIDGIAFNVAPLRRVALFPTRAGRQVIEPMVISCDLPTRGRRGSALNGFFDDSFFGRSARTLLVRSDSVEIEVLPLPEKARPDYFTGAVGDFRMRVAADPTELPVGEPVSLQVVVEGWGNMDAVAAPEITVPEGVKLYDPEVQSEERVEGDRIGGRRVYDYIIIPEVPGSLEIEPVRFAYFDPVSETYRSLASQPIRILTRGTAQQDAALGGYGLRRRDIEAVGADIRYIKPDVGALGQSAQLHSSLGFWGLQAVLPLVFVGLVLRQRHQQRLQGDVAYARRRRARGEAGRRLKSAREAMANGDSAGFHAEIQRALLDFIGDRLNVSAAGLSHEACRQLLASHGVAGSRSQALHDLLVGSDFARFASGGTDSSQMAETYRRTQGLIAQLEKVI
jgi:hypothetical protein